MGERRQVECDEKVGAIIDVDGRVVYTMGETLSTWTFGSWLIIIWDLVPRLFAQTSHPQDFRD